MAAELLQAGKLPIGNSRAESVLLSQQTAEALQAGLEVAGKVPCYAKCYC